MLEQAAIHGESSDVAERSRLLVVEDEMKQQIEIARQPRRDRLIRERIHDPYKTRLKLPEPTVCPQCGAVYHDGRWDWATRPEPAHEEVCQPES